MKITIDITRKGLRTANKLLQHATQVAKESTAFCHAIGIKSADIPAAEHVARELSLETNRFKRNKIKQS